MKPDPRSRPAVLLVAILAVCVLAAPAQGKRRAVRKPEPTVLRFTATRYAFTTAGAVLDPAAAVSMDVLGDRS